ncbi:sugar (pentulose or hexulose) kinase [Aquamicrobium terrae]
MVALCIDIGTSVVKAVAYDLEGQVLATLGERAPVLRPQPRWSEYDPRTIWDVVGILSRRILAQVNARKLDFIALTGQGDGCWLVDADGRETGNAVLWNDGRAHAIIERWTLDGTIDRAFRINGSSLFTGAQVAILTALREANDPRLDRARYVMSCKDWLASRFTGRFATERSDASLPWLDIASREYSQDLISIYGAEWAETLLPPLIPDCSIFGELTEAAARHIGVGKGVPVVVTPFDCVSMAIGARAVNPGQTVCVLGTTLIVETVVDTLDLSGPAGGMTLCTGLPDTWLRLFGTLSGTDTVNWTVSQFGFPDAYALNQAAENVPHGSNGVVFLPYLSPAGERAPFLDPRARASIVGLSLDHSRDHVARAMFEGLTCTIQHCLEHMPSPPTELRVTGGGASSPLWCQMMADMTQVPTLRLGVSELGAEGGFFVGLVATGRAPDIQTALAGVPAQFETFMPQASETDAYKYIYERFHRMRELAREGWSQ